jgi:hypothetical protein
MVVGDGYGGVEVEVEVEAETLRDIVGQGTKKGKLNFYDIQVLIVFISLVAQGDDVKLQKLGLVRDSE